MLFPAFSFMQQFVFSSVSLFSMRLRQQYFITLLLIILAFSWAKPTVVHAQTEPLLSRSNSVQYLIIAPSQFVPDVQEHARWRSQTTWTHPAMRTRIVTVEEINRSFADSAKNHPQSQAETIRSFISYTLQFWAGKPSHIMLVGSTNLIPSYRIPVTIPLLLSPTYFSREDSVPMDEWYVVNKYRETFNTQPQAAIGRIPGRNSTEIRRVLGKVRLFEEAGNTLGFDLSTRATVIIDAQDNDTFENQFLNLSDFLRYNVRQPLPSDILNFANIMQQPDARRQVTRAMSSNKPIVMYYGHGAPDEWSKYSILRTDDVGNNLTRNGKPFMMVTIGCSQNYDIPRIPSIVEALMLLDNGGSVMTLASSGYSSYPENNWFVRLFYEELFSKRLDVGTAILNAKQRCYDTGLPPQDNFFRRIALLGDPAMVPFSRLATSVAQQQEPAPQGISLAPNPTQTQSIMRYTLASAGMVRIELVNTLGQILFSYSQMQSAGEQSFTLPVENLPVGAYICRISTGTQHQSVVLTVRR